jgi:cytochrome c2
MRQAQLARRCRQRVPPLTKFRHAFGPSLAGVLGRQSGILPGFTFTPAMINAHLIWDAKTLDEFLTSSCRRLRVERVGDGNDFGAG